MAQVAPQSPTATVEQRIEHALTYLLGEWRDVPEVARAWARWPEHARLEFVIEWPLREDYWRRLQAWAAPGLLTPAQQARYKALQELVARHRPLIERLLAD